MSDLLEAASEKLGTPQALVQRSAAARAAAEGTDIDAILAAWAGGEAAPTAVKEEEPEPEEAAEAAEAPSPEEEEEAPADEAAEEAAEGPEPAPPVPTAIDTPPRGPDLVLEPEPEVELEPVPLGDRVRAAVRVGAWTGAALGLIGFLVAGAYWAPSAAFVEDVGPVLVVGTLGVMIGVALVSIIFGSIVASISRTAATWANPAMELSSTRQATAWIGAGLGLVLGLVGGAMLTGLGTPVEGTEGLVQLPVLTTFVVLLLGGAVLGGLTAAIPQLLGTPVAVEEDDLEEVRTIRKRLGDALGVPLVGLAILVLLVLPFAYLLIQSNHLLPRSGAALVGIITAGGILAFAALAGNRPQMRISMGDLLVAIAGIGTVLIVIIAVLLYSGSEEAPEEETGAEEAAIVLVV